MRHAKVYNHGIQAGILTETDEKTYVFEYDQNYDGQPISLTMPAINKRYEYQKFPPFFDGVLPEGVMLSALLKAEKIDAGDYFGQLVTVGNDLVGSVTVKELP
jgi:serine/threonine-protein kinase HipA